MENNDTNNKNNNNNNTAEHYHPATGLRILCLHDAHSSASSLKKELRMLGDRLYQKHGIDLVYINSPLCASVEDGDTDRIWYEKHDDNSDQLIGLDASLCLLQQIWSTMPFWGILGIGQGAAIGSLLSLLPEVKPKAKFGIFVHGQALIQEAEPLVEPDYWSCLHFVNPEKEGTQARLVQQFGGTVHSVPKNAVYSKKMMNVLGKFIIEQKKKMRQDGECRALALQNQLHYVEQQASRLIAQRIADDPPNILMAVVAPKAVGAVGMKRREPNEEGGGAPCPPEFLLRRETRSDLDAKGKSSRMHPSEKGASQSKQQQQEEEELEEPS